MCVRVKRGQLQQQRQHAPSILMGRAMVMDLLGASLVFCIVNEETMTTAESARVASRTDIFRGW